MDKKHQLNLTYIAIAFGLLLLFQFYWVSYTQVESIPYSRFQQLLKDKEVTKVVVGPNQIRGEFKNPQDGKKYFTTTRVDPAVADELEKHGVDFSGSAGPKPASRYPLLGASCPHFLRNLGLLHPPDCRQAGPWRPHERRAEPCENLR